MVLETRDFKRVLAIASCIFTCFGIANDKNGVSIDISICMFLMSNMLAFGDSSISSKYDTEYMHAILKIFFYLFWIYVFCILIDIKFTFIPNPVHIPSVIVSALFFLVISFFKETNEELSDKISKEIEQLSKLFSEGVDDAVVNVKNNGGWIRFMKTPLGQSFAEAVRENSPDKNPTDHKSPKHKKIKNKRKK